MTAYVPLAQSIDFPTQPFDNTLASVSNTHESVVKVLNSTTFTTNLTTKAFGAMSQINLPVSNLISNVVLVMKLQNVGGADGLLAVGQYLPVGWGFDAIDYCEYTYGTSSTLRVSGNQMRIWSLSQCESGEKQSAMLRLAGRPYNSDATTGEYLAMVNLPLPHSNVNSKRIIPYDLSLLSNKPSSIRIRFKYGTEWISQGSTGTQPVRAVAFNEVYVAFEQSYLADGPSDSIQSLVAVGGGAKYDYPFLYPQYFESKEFQGKSDKANKMQLQLDNFLPGSVQSIDMWLERITSDGPITETSNNLMSGSRQNKSWFVPMSNIEILYGGQSIYRSDDALQEIFTLSNYPTSGAFNVNVPPFAYAAGTGPADEVTRVSQYSHVQLSQYNEQFLNLIQTGAMLNNSSVTLRFTTPELRDLRLVDATPIAAQPIFKLHCNYNYQCSLRSAEGETSILFVRPEMQMANV